VCIDKGPHKSAVHGVVAWLAFTCAMAAVLCAIGSRLMWAGGLMMLAGALRCASGLPFGEFLVVIGINPILIELREPVLVITGALVTCVLSFANLVVILRIFREDVPLPENHDKRSRFNRSLKRREVTHRIIMALFWCVARKLKR
jgi:hypothetical protein